MELMTYEDFEGLLNGPAGVYYQGRWAYFSQVIEIVRSRNDISRVIELGPSFLPVVKDCDVMLKPEKDAWGRPAIKDAREYLNDATIIPWPIRNKEYDLFIALQVWEHLHSGKRDWVNLL